MPTTITYPLAAASLPDAVFAWYDHAGALIDFSTGYTFEAKVGNPTLGAVITKSANVAGHATAPNLRISWEVDELAELTPGRWELQVEATHTVSGQKRYLLATLIIEAAALA